MQARVGLFEADNRSVKAKLQALIDHPSTFDTVREVAINKLNKLLQTERSQSRNVVVNLSNSALDALKFGNVSCSVIYDRLCSIHPTPGEVFFMRQGQIILKVPPPFFGVSKSQYAAKIASVVPNITSMSMTYIDEVVGYEILISII